MSLRRVRDDGYEQRSIAWQHNIYYCTLQSYFRALNLCSRGREPFWKTNIIIAVGCVLECLACNRHGERAVEKNPEGKIQRNKICARRNKCILKVQILLCTSCHNTVAHWKNDAAEITSRRDESGSTRELWKLGQTEKSLQSIKCCDRIYIHCV